MVSQSKLHMWESQMEIQHFAYFDCVTTLKVLYRRTFIKSGAHIYTLHRCVKYSQVYTVCISPALNRSSEIQCFKHSNVVKTHNRITFDFYPGLPHILSQSMMQFTVPEDLWWGQVGTEHLCLGIFSISLLTNNPHAEGRPNL